MMYLVRRQVNHVQTFERQSVELLVYRNVAQLHRAPHNCTLLRYQGGFLHLPQD